MLGRISNLSGPISIYCNNPPIGKGSALFAPASNSYLSLAGSSDWAVGTGDFTVEWWQYQTNNGNENYLLSLGTGSTLALSIASGGGRVNVYLGGSKVANPTINGSIQNVWVGFAISRVGGTLYVFQGGSLLTSLADSSNITDSSSTLYVGVNNPAGSTNDNWPGNITNMHFVKGTGLYTANYTPSTSPLKPNANSKLLLRAESSGVLTTDKSGTNKTVTNNAATWSALTPF
jgi:hypothetical protein